MSNVESQNVIKVWDPLVRIFHWSLVLFFLTAYLTEDDFENIHIYAGYAVSILIGFRLIWGAIGPKYARFSNFVKGPAETLAYLKSLITGNPRHYIGHNPAGGIMVVALLVVLAATGFTGMALLAVDGGGPLAGTLIANFNEDLLEGLHELLANTSVLLVVLHVAGVLVSSLLHRENLIRAMFTGVKVHKAVAEEQHLEEAADLRRRHD
ncbi:cytochrome b/b6 domain-containing protein [Neptunomonas sp.]|uniref:cytochrome b/b6 domain-containing protein n=1 Tax=Neptunomonas sp. TaxID=1971898 RepID=UPI00356A7DEC